MLSVSSLTSQHHYPRSMDASGTINPAALNSPVSNYPHSYHPQPTHRGTKRSHSPEIYSHPHLHGEVGDEDGSNPHKRGRYIIRGIDSPNMSMQPLTPATPNTNQAPQAKSHLGSQLSPNQGSPQRSTPASGGKPPVVKALPTVRDHTTDQLNPEGDEYIPRERDDAGEKKVDHNGYLVDREYRLRTFTVPNRGEKLFMLATECARVLGYRDSYLLFNKNRSLFKIIANQEEKDNLISQDVLPYSYRSRQIAIVTARSMFRQFGSRVIANGRRVRDDYWESKARKQGFTEEDAAGEKRPGATKQREAAAAEAHANSLAALPHGQVVYSNAIGMDTPQVPPGIHPVTLATLPMINPLSPDEMHSQSYSHIIRPRQEISGSAYEDQTRDANTAEIGGQASSSAEFNKQLTQQRSIRSKYLDDYWKRPHEAPPSPAHSAGEIGSQGLQSQQHLQSPQQHGMTLGGQHSSLGHMQSSHLMQQPGYPGSQSQPQSQQSQPHQSQQQQQSSLLTQSPVRQMHQTLPSSQMQQGSPGLGMNQLSGRQHTPSYNYSTGGMWPPPQPSPHHMQSYGQQHHTAQPHQSQMQPPSQLPRQAAAGGIGYPQMGTPGAYGQMNRGMYQQGSPGQQQFGQQQQQHQMHAPMQGWGQPQTGMGGQDWQRGYQ